MGRIIGEGARRYLVQPAGRAVETMHGMRLGPHLSLDVARHH
jgi:hypothetical protein